MPCARSAQRRDVAERVAVLVDIDRERRALLQLRPGLVAGGERLLAVLDARLRERRQRLERLVERPVLVDVDLEGKVGHGPYGPYPLHVEAVAAAELELEPAKTAVACPFGVARHRVGVLERDRPRRRRPFAAKAEQAPDRNAGELPAEVVESGVDRRPRGEFLRGQPPEDLVQREGIVSERIGVRLEVRERGPGRLVVALDRRRLAVSDQALVTDLDLHDLDLGLGPARDRERLLELERGDSWLSAARA